MVNATLQDVPPFYKPDTPPPSLPIPLAQTEIGNVHLYKPLAQEELGPPPAHFRASSKGTSMATPRNILPKTIDAPGSDSDSDLSILDSSSDSDTDSGSDSDNLIAKPDGEAGRPGRGGYNLEDALAWDKADYRRLKKNLKKLVEEHLVTTENFRSQTPASILAVQASMTQKHPILRGYEGCWPVMDLIRLELKYTCSRARLAKQKGNVKAGKRPAQGAK